MSTQDQAEFARVMGSALAGNALPPEVQALGPILLAEYADAVSGRAEIEQRWLTDLRQYKGKYDPDELAKIGSERSRAFVRKTRVKVKTADSRVADLLFPAGSEKNWGVEPTPVPTLSDEQQAEIKQLLGQMQALAQQQGAQVPEQDEQRITMLVAKEAAKKMATVIEDQLTEARYKQVCLDAIHSGHLYGTGIIKGPLVERKMRSRFAHKDGKWLETVTEYIAPFIDFVPLWRFYPDKSANTLAMCRYVFERHVMVQSDLAELAERKSFDCEAIRRHIRSNPNGYVSPDTVTDELRAIGDRMNGAADAAGSFEVLERWGYLTGSQLSSVGVEVPECRLHESFFSNVWLLPSGVVIKAVLQPLNGVTWPYHLYYFDRDETSLFGEGLATILRDDQSMINAGTRMILDNGAITAGPMFEVNQDLLSRTERMDEIAPWKVWRRNSNSPGQRAVVPIQASSNVNELSAIVGMFDRNADEVSAIPRYMSGENVNSGAAGTASGMSMLMGAVNIVIKDLINSWDEGVTRPFLTAMYRWNMQFNDDKSIKGDFNVKARGTASLVAKEVRSRQLNEFAAMTSNPMDAPYVKRDVLLRYRAEAAEMPDVIKTDEEIKAESAKGGAAEMQMQMQMQQAQLQLAQLQENLAKSVAETERIKAQAALAMAQAEAARANALDKRVEAIYAAIQAGAAAAGNPGAAPAGDEVLRSVGWKDATPSPQIAELMDAAVQGGHGVNPATGKAGARQGIETVVNDA